MQHLAHCPPAIIYTTHYPLNVDFIDILAPLYDKIRGRNLGLCRHSEEGLQALPSGKLLFIFAFSDNQQCPCKENQEYACNNVDERAPSAGGGKLCT